MIVVDASAVVSMVVKNEAGAQLAQRLRDAGETLHAPHLLDIEVAHTLRRLESRGQLAPDRARDALMTLAMAPIARYPHGPLLPRIWELRSNMTAYDAAYVALAEVLEATLVTHDAKLASAPGHDAQIDLI